MVIYVLALFAINLVLGVFHSKLTAQHARLAQNEIIEMQDEVCCVPASCVGPSHLL